MIKWIVDGEEEYTNIEELLYYVCDPEFYEDVDAFNEYLDDNEDEIEIYGYRYSPSDVLRNVESDDYYEALREWADTEADNHRNAVRRDIEDLVDGESYTVNGYNITCFDYEEEELSEQTENRLEAERKRQEERSLEIKAWDTVFTVRSIL